MAKKAKPYHHGDLAPELRKAARAILEEEGLAALSLRSVARRAGVSHAAPYRHYQSREALLADVAAEGVAELREEIIRSKPKHGDKPERVVLVGAAYLHFAARHPGLLRLMFGSELPNRAGFPGLEEATISIGDEIGRAIGDPMAGLAVWATIHGLAVLTLDNVIDLGQRQDGLEIMPARAAILLRSFVESLTD